jgi:hypothetical protein
MRALAVVAVTVLSMLAAGLAAAAVFGAADGHWLAALGYGLGAVAPGTCTALLFRAVRGTSPRDRGRH